MNDSIVCVLCLRVKLIMLVVLLFDVCVLCLQVKLIMLVVLLFDMQCMHIGGIV